MSDTPSKAAEEATKAGIFAKIKNNYANEGKGKLALRGAGAVVSLGVLYDGAKRMLRGVGVIAPKIDDEGKEVTAGAGSAIGGLVEFSAGAAGLWFALVHPGKAQALSK